MLKKYIYLLFFSVGLFINIGNSQYLGGAVQIDYVADNCPGQSTVNFRIKIYTQSDLPQLDSIPFHYGNGNIEKIPRSIKQSLGDSLIYHEYITSEAYNSCGIYTSSYFDTVTGFKGTNAQNQNIFFLETQFIISAQSSYSLPEISTVPFQLGNSLQDIRHCILTKIPLGDSLFFELENFNSSAYQLPANASLNSITGELKMIGPNIPGIYRFLIGIEVYKPIGAVGKIITPVTIVIDSNSSAAEMAFFPTPIDSGGFAAVEIFANQPYSLNFTYTDSLADSISLLTSGEPFYLQSAASCNQSNFQDTIKGQFDWQPDTSDVRKKAYILYFNGKSYRDSSEFNYYRALMIYVKSPSISLSEVPYTDFKISIAPNPVSHTIHFISGNHQYETLHGQVSLSNVQGKLFWTGPISLPHGYIDVTNLPKGYYFIQFNNPDNNIYFTKKILKN